jgi:N-acetylglutamate synthase-like GNAT family acetyltransferase
MTIRAFDPGEAEVLVDVLRRSFATVAEQFDLTEENCPRHIAFYTTERLKEDVGQGMQFYVLEDSGQLCGCVALEPSPKPGVSYLGRLAVLPRHRSKGLGRTLVRHAMARAKADGVERVEIGLIAEDEALRDWYRQFGFEDAGTKEFPHLPFVVGFMATQL